MNATTPNIISSNLTSYNLAGGSDLSRVRSCMRGILKRVSRISEYCGTGGSNLSDMLRDRECKGHIDNQETRIKCQEFN